MIKIINFIFKLNIYYFNFNSIYTKNSLNIFFCKWKKIKRVKFMTNNNLVIFVSTL